MKTELLSVCREATQGRQWGLRSTMPAGLELTHELFHIPGEFTCDKLEILC